MATLTGTRVDTWLVHLAIDNRFLGTWDTFSGGEVDSEEAKYRPGGMSREISLGGRQTVGNVTISRYWDDQVNGWYPWLQTRVGKARATIIRYPMTADGVQLGRGQSYGGTLKRVQAPDHDSMGSDAALMELEITVDQAS